MSALRIAFRTSLSSLLRPSRFGFLSLATLALLLFLLLPVAGSEGTLFSSRVEILRACLLFPGILVALELRRAWPALGPEDEAQVWLHLSGSRAWPARMGAWLGALTSLLVLLGFQALIFGLALSLLPGRPDFHQATALPRLATASASGSTHYLVQPGDAETFELPGSRATRQAARGLLLKPLWSMGPRHPIEVELFTASPDGPWRSLGRARFREPGEIQRLSLGTDIASASRLQVRRLSPAGTLISLALGEVLLLGPELGNLQTGLRAALPYLPWALLLLLAGLSLCALLSPAFWGLAVLALIPLIGQAPGFGGDRSGPHLGQGLSSLPALPGIETLLLGLTLLALGLFLPRRVRPPELSE